MKVALYARVSTRDKDQNPEQQLLLLRQFIQPRGWTVYREYVDLASAKDMRGRLNWNAMIGEALHRPRPFDAVVITKLDRAFRSVKDTYDYLSKLAKADVGFVTATQPIETTTAAGKLLLGILAAFAEFEANLISERTKEGMALAKLNGAAIGKRGKDKAPRRRSGYYAYHAAKNGGYAVTTPAETLNDAAKTA